MKINVISYILSHIIIYLPGIVKWHQTGTVAGIHMLLLKDSQSNRNALWICMNECCAICILYSNYSALNFFIVVLVTSKHTAGCTIICMAGSNFANCLIERRITQ